MQDIANKVSIWTTILGVPTVIGWYLDHAKVITLPAGWNETLVTVAVCLIVTALVANAVSHAINQKPTVQPTQAQSATIGAATATQFKKVDEFYQTYSSRMVSETEVLVRAESDQYPPGADREKYLVRVTALFVTIIIFEKVWFTIYGSQLKALQQLNLQMLTYDEMRRYYDEAAKAHPEIYKDSSFELWLGYLKIWLLILEHDPTHLEITVRGQDFLRYLLEARYDTALRVG
jgi:hypothetical protein